MQYHVSAKAEMTWSIMTKNTKLIPSTSRPHLMERKDTLKNMSAQALKQTIKSRVDEVFSVSLPELMDAKL